MTVNPQIIGNTLFACMQARVYVCACVCMCGREREKNSCFFLKREFITFSNFKEVYVTQNEIKNLNYL